MTLRPPPSTGTTTSCEFCRPRLVRARRPEPREAATHRRRRRDRQRAGLCADAGRLRGVRRDQLPASGGAGLHPPQPRRPQSTGGSPLAQRRHLSRAVPTGIAWKPSGDRHVASIPTPNPGRRELNSSGALLVELADGKHSVREIATYLRAAHQLGEDPTLAILDFYAEACSVGLVTWEDHHG